MVNKPNTKKKLTRCDQRDLQIEISFLEGVVRRDPAFIEALQILGNDYTRLGRHTEGLVIDQAISQMRPEDPNAHYNLACSYALTEQIEEAVTALEQAVDRGFHDYLQLAEDPDLENLRKHPLFKKVRAKLRSRKARHTD